MNINSTTRFAGLLAHYPFLDENLAEINEIFSLLKTPLINNMIKKSTISDMSRKSGMDEAALIRSIENLIASRYVSA